MKNEVEMIATHFNATSQEYNEIKSEDIEIPEINPQTILKFTEVKIKELTDKIKTNKSAIPGDISARIVKKCSEILCTPMTHIINHSIKSVSWANLYKEELKTPIGKVLTVELLEQLRPISNLPICNKIQEAAIAEIVISDMKSKLDPS